MRRGEEGYENARRGSCWHDRVPDRHPEIIVLATGTEDVAAAVRLARAEGLGVSVRSGGHSWSGSHLRDGAVLIDLSNLREVDVDPQTLTAEVQPGITGAELSGMLATQGLFFPTGHSTGVGIGGYLLQGGFGWAGRDYGPACMSVIGIEAVTADGEIVHADENENADLLWAARGAGPGFFAVVTRFTLRVYPARAITRMSTYVYPIGLAREVFEFVHTIARETPLELLTLITRNPANEAAAPDVVLVGVSYTDEEGEARRQLGLLDTCPVRDRALLALTDEPTDHVTLVHTADGGRFSDSSRWISDNVGTRAPFSDLWPAVQEMIDSWPAGWRTHLMVFNWDSDTQPARPPMAFSVRGDLFYGLYAEWTDSAQDAELTEWVTDRMRALEPHASGTALSDENLLNRPFPFMSDENLRRLDDLRSTWDPTGMFVAWLGRPDVTA